MSVERKWSPEELSSDSVSKKDIISFLHGNSKILLAQIKKWKLENAADCFLVEKKIKGSAKNVAKKPKEVLIEAFEDLFKTGAFKGSELDVLVEKIEKVQVEKDRIPITCRE